MQFLCFSLSNASLQKCYYSIHRIVSNVN